MVFAPSHSNFVFICHSTSPLLAVLHSVCIDPMHTNKSPSRPCSPRRPPRRRTPLGPRQRRPSSPPRLPPTRWPWVSPSPQSSPWSPHPPDHAPRSDPCSCRKQGADERRGGAGRWPMRVPAEAGKRRRGVAEVRRESAQPAPGSGTADTAGKRCGLRGCSARTRPRHPRSQRPHDAAAVVPAPSGGVARSWEAESRRQRLGDMWAAEARRQ